MCAAYRTSGTVESVNPAFEALLVHLAVESHGLSQSGMLRLFCGAAGKYFGASDACCSSFSNREGWIIVETEGRQLWGCPGDSLTAATADRLDLALRTGKAMFCEIRANEFLCRQGDGEHSEVAVPFLSHGKSLGAALLLRPEATGQTDQRLVEQLTLLGAFFA